MSELQQSKVQQVTGGEKASSGGTPGVSLLSGLQREDTTDVKAWGKAIARGRAKYSFDVLNVRKVPGVHATDNSRMAPDEFSAAMEKLLVAAGLGNEGEERKLAFVRGVFFAHAINSGSTLAPGRARIVIAGCRRVYNYHDDVLRILGNDARRFFRAAADDIALLLRELLDSKAYAADDSLEMIVSVEQVAEERGLGRIPHLAFDAADACSDAVTTVSERAAVRNAKARTVGNVYNAVDNVDNMAELMASKSNGRTARQGSSQGVAPVREGVMPY